MPVQLAVDFGTTNTVVAVAESGNVRIVNLPELGRLQPLAQPSLIPTAVHVSDSERRWLFFRRRIREVRIGQQALNRNYEDHAGLAGTLARSFKPMLGEHPDQPVVHSRANPISARSASILFLQELLTSVRKSGIHPTDLTMSTPVGYFEPFRAELQSIAKQLKIPKFHALDEPVAAAIGYGVNVQRDETLLVIDFGGGTLDLAAVRLGPAAAEGQAVSVLAKHMVRLGGNDVDQWLLEKLVMKMDGLPGWEYEALWEVMRAKEQASREGAAEFRWSGIHRRLTRDDLVGVLTERGLYHQLRTALTEIQQQLGEATAVDEVLLVGGSTLLPEVAAVVDGFFPRAVVRHDPEFVFTAVASGTARFAGGLPVDDHVYHDYALAVLNDKTNKVEYERLVPRHTRYPTPTDFAVRYYADYPGQEEMRFEVCEVGRLGQSPVLWETRPNGNEYWDPRTPTEETCRVVLNAADAPLPIRPTGQGTSPRLRVTYAIDASRWLCRTVEDLVRKETLRDAEPVIKLR